ncbi:MAG: hypothetical protein ACI4D0_10480 [Lachnospira sp.]
MKELKKRIKGLSAILLAVSLALCLVVRFSGVRASAEAKMYTVGNNTISSEKTIQECVGVIFSEVGDGLNKTSSGGNFALGDGNLDAFKEYLTFTEGYTASDGETVYYTKVEVQSNNFPSGYESIKISKCEAVTKLSEDGTETIPVEVSGEDVLYRLTFEWVPKTTISVGIPTAMTTGTQYSFPSGSSTHKVQGDPTVYYGTSFYVSSSGTYTILQ